MSKTNVTNLNQTGIRTIDTTSSQTIAVLQRLFDIYHNVDENGPTASSIEIVEAWIQVRDLLCKLKQI